MSNRLLRYTNSTARNFSRNILRGAFGRKVKPRLKYVLKYLLRALIKSRSPGGNAWRISLPTENFLAFLGVPFDPINRSEVTVADVANAIRENSPTEAVLAKTYAKIGDAVAQGNLHRNLGLAQKLVLVTYSIWIGHKSRAISRIDIPGEALFTSLAIPVADIEKVLLRPCDVICEFVAHNTYSNKRLRHVYADVAHVLSHRGQPDLAAAYYRRSLSIAPDNQVNDRLLHAMVMAPSTTNESMFDEALSWAKQYSPKHQRARKFDLNRDPDRRLRVGYTCCFFYDLGTRIAHLPLMLGHDRNNFEVVAYSDDSVDDAFHVADIWRNTGNLDHEAFARLVLNDQIDILVEFNGRGGRSRFEAFAMRIAPIQMNFGNFPATTGIPQVDYTIAHAVDIRPEDDRFYTEKVCRLECMAVDYTQCWPKDFFPEVAPSPYRATGRITFGCFGSSFKVSEESIRDWCEIVNKVEGARIYFKSLALGERDTMESFRRLFQRYGVADNRLILEGGSSHRKMLELYGRVDIALDTFPYNGGNTSLEALWQGIPVISLQGSRWASRQGARFLIQAGLQEFIARSRQEFIDKAVSLAKEHELRDNFRQTAREKLRKSLLFDMPRWIHCTESAYRDMWINWLGTISAQAVATSGDAPLYVLAPVIGIQS